MNSHRGRLLVCLFWGLSFIFDAASSYVIQTNPEWMELNPLIRPIISATSLQLTFLVLAPVAVGVSVAVLWRLPRQVLWCAGVLALAEFLNGQICWYRYVADIT